MRSSGWGLAPIILSTPILYQCVVAGKPFKIPAAPKINPPLQTEAVQVVVSCTLRSQSSTSSSTIWLGVVVPPCTSTRSGEGVSATVCVTPSSSARSLLVLFLYPQTVPPYWACATTLPMVPPHQARLRLDKEELLFEKAYCLYSYPYQLQYIMQLLQVSVFEFRAGSHGFF
jgi:hypothetical protein